MDTERRTSACLFDKYMGFLKERIVQILAFTTEFKYGTSFDDIHKLYLSVILDLYDRRPVAYVLGDSNNNQLVFDTFDLAVSSNPDAHPVFHSDRGFQYTSRAFHYKLE